MCEKLYPMIFFYDRFMIVFKSDEYFSQILIDFILILIDFLLPKNVRNSIDFYSSPNYSYVMLILINVIANV